MTEEIIIDGINVRDCNRCNPFHYDRGASEYPICLTSLEQWGGLEHYCNQRPNCYYKQFKRLEQENKDLKDNNNHLQVIIDDGRAENKRFREENKELEEKIKKYSAINEQDTKDYAILRNALEEIKDLVKEISYLGSQGERELKFKIRNILEDVIDEEVY